MAGVLSRAVADSRTPNVERVVTETVTTAKVLKGDDASADAFGEAYAESSEEVSAGAAGIAKAVCRDGEDEVVAATDEVDDSDDDTDYVPGNGDDVIGDADGDVEDDINGGEGAGEDDVKATDYYYYYVEPETKPVAEKPTVEKPAVEKLAAEKPAVEKPEAEKPEAEKPAATQPENKPATVADPKPRVAKPAETGA